ncbi:MAG: CDP-alcohol phosphatidyltransferase family protein [Eubacteriales bacterium]|nr:CDP-alcohol phosphatidyltransferase family protein [Eubacteriales bacterium]MDY3333242.1 CDP-alcohol phosphatidyltransferase family protein [Gallibacter sp.]
MIGFYNYTVILTYMSLASSVLGMILAFNGHFRLAIMCLALSGLFDMFDGKVARTKKNRSEDEKMFGVQLDSLCDVVCFGFYPAILCYSLGMRGYVAIAVIVFYVTCAVIRLAFFNVLEINRQKVEGGANKFYHGLPVTSIAVILPIVFLLNFMMSIEMFYLVLVFTFAITGLAFIIDFKLRKPNNKELFILVIIVAVVVIASLNYRNYVMIHPPTFFY